VRPKLLHFDAEMAEFPDPLGVGHKASFLLALLSEGGCAAAACLGILTRLVSIPVVFTMTMVLVLGAQGFAGADVQLALLYALPYVALVLLGPGAYSLDARLSSRYDAVVRWVWAKAHPLSPASTDGKTGG
jgi:putative oxidoreductase